MSKLTRVPISLLKSIENLGYVTDTFEGIPDTVGTISYKGRYFYTRMDASMVDQSTVDGIEVIQTGDGSFWKLKHLNELLASDFCTDTPSLQRAYTVATLHGVPFVIDKLFENLHCVTEDPEHPGNRIFMSVIRALSNSTIEFRGSGGLSLAPHDIPQTNVIYVHNVSEVKILDPVLVGDRRTNTSGRGEHGWGLTILQCSNLYVRGGSYSQMWGDGIYIGKKWGSKDTALPTNVLIDKPRISYCRRNGISLCSGDNVVIRNPQIYNIGDSDGIQGAFPKAGIDVEPEVDEDTVGVAPARLIQCVIEDPYVNGAFAGIDFNIFPKDLQATVTIKGALVLENITGRGITATRIKGGGTGLIHVDRVVYRTRPTDAALFEMLGGDSLRFNIDELVDVSDSHGNMNIRLYPRTYNSTLSRKFGNLRIGKCTSVLGTYTLLAGLPLNEYFLDIEIGREEDPIGCSLEYSGQQPAQLRGFIGGIAGNITQNTNTKVTNSTVVVNTLAQASNVTLNTQGDFRKLTVRKMANSEITHQVALSGVKVRGSSGDSSTIHATQYGSSVTIQNKEGSYTNILAMHGDWNLG